MLQVGTSNVPTSFFGFFCGKVDLLFVVLLSLLIFTYRLFPFAVFYLHSSAEALVLQVIRKGGGGLAYVNKQEQIKMPDRRAFGRPSF